MEKLRRFGGENFFLCCHSLACEDTSDRDIFFLILRLWLELEDSEDPIKESSKDDTIDGQCKIYIFYLIKDEEKDRSQS